MTTKILEFHFMAHSTKIRAMEKLNVNSIVLDKNHIDQDITFSNVPSN